MNILYSVFRPLVVAACAVCAVVGGCASPGGTGGTAPKQSISSAFEGYKEAWNRHDVNALMGYFGSTGSLSSPAGADPMSGEVLERWLGGLFSGIPDFRVEVVSLDVVGEHRVVDQWVISGTWTRPFPSGPLQGAKPTGKPFKVPGAGFYDWQNGRIAKAVNYLDNMSFVVQIGAVPPPGVTPLATK